MLIYIGDERAHRETEEMVMLRTCLFEGEQDRGRGLEMVRVRTCVQRVGDRT